MWTMPEWFGAPECADICLLILPQPHEDYFEYQRRAQNKLRPMDYAQVAIGVQNTWIYHPDSPHNRVYPNAA